MAEINTYELSCFRSCGLGPSLLSCGQTHSSSDPSGNSGNSGYNSDTYSDNNSIVYDCIKSDLQAKDHHGHHQPHQPLHQQYSRHRNHPSLRSVQSLSSKYSENKKYSIKKNASMYVKSDSKVKD